MGAEDEQTAERVDRSPEQLRRLSSVRSENMHRVSRHDSFTRAHRSVVKERADAPSQTGNSDISGFSAVELPVIISAHDLRSHVRAPLTEPEGNMPLKNIEDNTCTCTAH